MASTQCATRGTGSALSLQQARPLRLRAPRAAPVRRGVRASAAADEPESVALTVNEPTAIEETTTLGQSDVEISSVGVGAWAWGDRSGYWGGYSKEENREAFKAVLEAGVTFIDTAEVYGFGLSEEFIGEFMAETGATPVIATKFAPLPWRFTSESVVDALEDSLKRLGLKKVGLYMQHWPGFLVNAFSNDAYLEGLATCKQMGLCDAVGVSNFNAERLRRAHGFMASRGIPLASNQVQYSLLYRAPEKTGVLDVCREKGITLMAYSPLAQGLLTGKYTPDNIPEGARSNTITRERIIAVQPLIDAMREIGEGHGGKTCAQVAVNWTLCKGCLPIPGVKNRRQMEELAGAFGWRMTDEEVERLDSISDSIPEALGAPFENW